MGSVTRWLLGGVVSLALVGLILLLFLYEGGDASPAPASETAPTTLDAGSTTSPPSSGDQETATSISATTEPPIPEACDPPDIALSGPQDVKFDDRELPAAIGIDAREASWEGVGDYGVVITSSDDGSGGGCWLGGYLDGQFPDSYSWDRMHDTAAFEYRIPNFTIQGIEIHNFGDGITIKENSTDFVIRRAHMSYIRDDCVENDKLYSGVIEDSLFDGCYMAFSARGDDDDPFSNGVGELWTIRNSLIRLQPMPTVYKDEGLIPGHGGFFKWDFDGLSPDLALHNNIFRVDQASNHTGLGVPENLVSCSNNVVVWLGEGDYPDQDLDDSTLVPLPSCFTITTDPTVWDDAVAAWKAG